MAAAEYLNIIIYKFTDSHVQDFVEQTKKVGCPATNNSWSEPNSQKILDIIIHEKYHKLMSQRTRFDTNLDFWRNKSSQQRLPLFYWPNK